jgi:hypothetical protein
VPWYFSLFVLFAFKSQLDQLHRQYPRALQDSLLRIVGEGDLLFFSFIIIEVEVED